MMIHVVTYDVENDRTRGRVAALLEGYGQRVQKSVFECRLGEREMKELVSRLQEELGTDPGGQVRIYRVCDQCMDSSFGLGSVKHEHPQHCYIV